MADKPSNEKRRAVQEAARSQRDDWFSRVLGEDWVAVEPGIYRQATWHPPTHVDEPTDSDLHESTDSLDDSLLEAIQTGGENPPQPDQSAPVTRAETHSHWWRR